MALRDGQVLIKDADATQMAIIKSWNKMRWNKSTQMLVGIADLELLDKLARLVRLPPSIDGVRMHMQSVQDAVDKERIRADPKPYVKYPVTKKLYEHQIRAANMALLTFGMLDPKEVCTDEL